MRKIYVFLMLFIFLISYEIYSQQQFYKLIAQLPGPRQMYGSVVLGDYIYLIGGNTQGKGDSPEGYSTDVEKALINPNGTLGRWEKTTQLISSRSYINNTTIALNDVVYVVAGYDGRVDKKTNSIYWTRPLPNGHLEKWRESPAYPGKGISCSAAVATPGYLNLIGGNDESGQVSNLVWSAKVAPDGSITGWEQGNSLPVPLWFHCAGVAGGKVWVWGGLTANDNNATNKIVYSAPILSSGKIGPWAASGSILPQPFYSASSTVSGSFLLTFCPRYTAGIFSNDIWYANATSQGLTQWQKVSTEITSKLFVGVATDYRRGFVYIPGGRIDQKEEETSLDKNVYFFALSKREQSDAKSDATITVDVSRKPTGAEHLSYVQQVQQTKNTVSNLPGFIPYEQARQFSTLQRIPMVVYLYSNKANKCIEQNQLMQNFNTSIYNKRVIFAEIDTVQFPQFAQQQGVFKIPCWIFFDSYGKEKFRNIGLLQLNELDIKIRQIIQ